MSDRETTHRHECAAMRAECAEDGRSGACLTSLDGEPWRLTLSDGGGWFVFVGVTYCPWCGTRLDGQREEGC